ncbi:hypothetical protein [Streptomyces sp. CBMA29]|uniref:hypothetical protein n=1 Tax=Streptomyces sp. CBMA29 TaxID=1896314 RepID=UPI0016619ECD|nr:hypothetical protein [Streptomyces sp. CBMA29]
MTYDLTVADLHSYYALAGTAAVLVHNCDVEINQEQLDTLSVGPHAGGEEISTTEPDLLPQEIRDPGQGGASSGSHRKKPRDLRAEGELRRVDGACAFTRFGWIGGGTHWGANMKIGEVEVVLNHGLLVIGSGENPEFDLLMNPPPVSDQRHVMVATRAQIAPVRVGVWRGISPVAPRLTFSGRLLLATGYLTFRESSEQPFFAWPAASSGSSIVVSVGTDAWDAATDVTVVIDPSPESWPDLTSREGFVASSAEVSSISQIDRVLAGHNYPEERLAAALRILSMASEEGVSAPRIRYGVESVREWMKWLHPAISANSFDGVPEIIDDTVAGTNSVEVGVRAVMMNISTAIGVTAEELMLAHW